MLEQLVHPLQVEEMRLLLRLREARRRHRQARPEDGVALGDRVSDAVAATVGSWRFIIIQSVILAIWMALNVTGYVEHWDPYPFILLNLVLSFQAAYTAPVIMMSQNRQANIDRQSAQHDYDINIKSELEIELLHQKIDMLREKEFADLVVIIRGLEAQLARTQEVLIGLSNK
jgi:uncharacterized membrane protein